MVVTEEAVDGRLRPVLDTVTMQYLLSISLSTSLHYILGKVVSLQAQLDLGLARSLVATGLQDDQFQTVLGKTISTDDFYEGQVRTTV